MSRYLKLAVLFALTIFLFSPILFGQASNSVIIQAQNSSGTPLLTRASGIFILKPSGGVGFAVSGSTLSISATGTGGLTAPGSTNVLVKYTTGVSTAAASFGDIVAVFGGGSCSGYLKSDGTCGAGGGSGTVTSFSVAAVPSWLTSSVATSTTTPALTLGAATGQTTHQVIGTGVGTSFAPIALTVADLPTGTTSSTVPLGNDVRFLNATSLNGTSILSLTGILKLTSGTPSNAAAADVIALFNGGTCSGYLKSDGTCGTPGGSGTVTSFSVTSVPSWLSSSVATATSTPALTLGLATGQTAHQVIGTGAGSSFAPLALTTADLPTSVVSAVTNDTNVTGSITSGTITLGWTGTLAKTRLLGTTVFTDQANSFSTGLQDFTASTLKLPSAASYAPTTSALFGYNSTNNSLVAGVNGSTGILGYYTGTQPTANDCVKWGTNPGTLADAGAACGAGSGGDTITSPGGSINVGGTSSATTLDVNTTYTNSLYPQLTATSTYAAGAKQIFSPSATTAGIRITGGPDPSAPGGGDLAMTSAALFHWYTGSQWDYSSWYTGTAPVSGDCLQAGSNGQVVDSGSTNCGGGGGGSAFQVNGTPLTSSTTVNFLNSSATNGLTLSFANPAVGNVQLGFSGTLNVVGGGTGATALATHGVVIGQGTTAVNVTTPGTTGYALISNGASADPTFQVIVPTSTNITGGTTGTVPKFSAGNMVNSALSDSGAIVATTEPLNLKTNPLESEFPNAAAGTVTGSLVKLIDTAGALQVTKTATTDTNNAFGCVQSGAGTTGTAQVSAIGVGSCLFDNVPLTDGDYFIVSTSVAGTASDAGTTLPTGVLNLGRVSGSHVACGSAPCGPYSVILQTPDAVGAAGTGIQASPAAVQTLQPTTDVTGLIVKQSNTTNTADVFDIKNKTGVTLLGLSPAGVVTGTAIGSAAGMETPAKSLGFFCDGTTDDSGLFNSATTTGLKIHLPDGATCLAANINPKAGTQYICSGCVIKKLPSDTTHYIMQVTNSNVTFRGVTFDMGGQNIGSYTGAGIATSAVTVSSGGSGFGASVNILLSFTGGACSSQPNGYATTNGSGVVTSVTLVTPGGGCTSNPTINTTWTSGTACPAGGCVAPTFTYATPANTGAPQNYFMIYANNSPNLTMEDCTFISTGSVSTNLSLTIGGILMYKGSGSLIRLNVQATVAGYQIKNDSGATTGKWLVDHPVLDGSGFFAFQVTSSNGTDPTANMEVSGGTCTGVFDALLGLSTGSAGNCFSVFNAAFVDIHDTRSMSPRYSAIRVTGSRARFNKIHNNFMTGAGEASAWLELGAENNEFTSNLIQNCSTGLSATNVGLRPTNGRNQIIGNTFQACNNFAAYIDHDNFIGNQMIDSPIGLKVGFGGTGSNEIISDNSCRSSGVAATATLPAYPMQVCMSVDKGLTSSSTNAGVTLYNNQAETALLALPVNNPQLNISNITAAATAVVTFASAPASPALTVGQVWLIANVQTWGGSGSTNTTNMTQINGLLCAASAVTTTTMTCGGAGGTINSSAFTAFALNPTGNSQPAAFLLYSSGTVAQWSWPPPVNYAPALGAPAVRRVSSADTATLTDDVIVINAVSAAVTETLPAMVPNGYRLILKRVDASAFVVTVTGGTIEGNTTLTITAGTSYELVYESTTASWWII